MGCRLVTALFLVSIIIGSKNCANTAFKGSDVEEKFNDKTVQELESLRIFADVKVGSERSSSDEVAIIKSQKYTFTDLNGHKSAKEEIENEVDKNGKILAKVSQKVDSLETKEELPKSVIRTEIEIPSKDIRHGIKNDENMELALEKKKESNFDFKGARNGMDKMNNFSEIKYNPHDMAEYIFWTGDEKGVALTIEEFLQEGLMTRQEAVNFLQTIKYSLDLMQSQYKILDKVNDKLSNKDILKRKLKKKEKFVQTPKKNFFEEQQDFRKLIPVHAMSLKPESSEVVSDNRNTKQNSHTSRMNFAKSDYNKKDFEPTSKSYSKLPSIAKIFDGESLNDDDYDEILEILRISDFLKKESSLEEVVFQLAKVIFSEGLIKGNKEAQKAFQRFSNFLQNQVQHKQVSVDLQRKILDVLLSALIDALSEHPELLERLLTDRIIWDRNSSTSEALKQLLKLGAKRLTDKSKKAFAKNITSRK